MAPDAGTISAVIFSVLGVALLLGVPIGYALGVATAAALYLSPIPSVYLAQTLYTGTELFPLIAIPGFILAGQLMVRSGITDKIIRVVYVLVGNLAGGLAIVTILACAVFASISGSGPATTAAIGSIMIAAMVKAGYPVAFAAAITATGGTLGVLIPPSNPMIIYGVVANLSISSLFFAGFLPGFLLVIVLASYSYVVGRRRGLRGSGEAFDARNLLTALVQGFWALLMPVVVLGSIYGGFATPTESSMLAVVYTLLVGVVSRRLTLTDITEAMISTGRMTGAVLVIMGPAMAFGRLLTMYQVPTMLAGQITELTTSPVAILLLISGILVIAGTFMETLSTIILVTPVFLPVLIKVGVDPVQFGILFVVMAEIGFLTPPLGVNLFVASAISQQPMEALIRELVPLVGLLLLFSLLIILVPWISTWGYYYMSPR
jgi:C4-dicarboxylate transporter DctM subunit